MAAFENNWAFKYNTVCSTFMINSHISILFRELNEILSTIASRTNYDTNSYVIDLIKNLKLIKNKLQTERWIERWNEDELKRKMNSDYRIPRSIITQIDLVSGLVIEMIDNNDCYVATKVSRTLLKIAGKVFQGISKLIIT